MIIDVTWFGSHVTKNVMIIKIATDDALFWFYSGSCNAFFDSTIFSRETE